MMNEAETAGGVGNAVVQKRIPYFSYLCTSQDLRELADSIILKAHAQGVVYYSTSWSLTTF